jgi:hypothetical protein
MQPIKFIKISLCKFLPITQAVTIRNAEDGFTTLQKWYNQSSGLWIPSTGWWNSANCKQPLPTFNQATFHLQQHTKASP